MQAQLDSLIEIDCCGSLLSASTRSTSRKRAQQVAMIGEIFKQAVRGCWLGWETILIQSELIFTLSKEAQSLGQ